MNAPRDARLDDELAFIEVSNALATLAARQPRSLSPVSPWVLRSVPAVPDPPFVAAPPILDRSALLMVSALVAMLVVIPIAALTLSFY